MRQLSRILGVMSSGIGLYYLLNGPAGMAMSRQFGSKSWMRGGNVREANGVQYRKDGSIKKHKRNVTAIQKKQVAASQKWHCAMCKQMLDETYEVDHILPLFKGGNNSNNNLQALCPNCHKKKTYMDLNSD